ncbi:hypothetical protein HYW74_03440 [Candidatus Pacearchaeota archaeon]|nr:hypothetical protein [Candidatus Pacearchaeota archaeon]
MKTEQLLKELEGIKTIKIIQDRFNIDRARAIYLVYRLRKRGYVKTKYASDKMRVYYINKANKLEGTSYIEIINKYAPTAGIKLADYGDYIIYGKIPSIEETLIYAIKRRSVRYVIACLSLYRQIKDWSHL